jgi:MFS transporter, YNFM family, putative membrane transport protein
MTTDHREGLATGRAELRRLNLAMVCSALAAFGMLYATQALLPPIGAGFGVGPTAASLTVSAATGGIALAMMPLSSLAESVGRVPVMRGGLLAACLLTFLSAGAPWFWALLVIRALVGVALAAVVAVAVAHLGDEVHPARLGTAIGLYVAGNTLGGITGRLVPGLVEEATSWRVGIAALGVLALVASVGFVRLLPPARRRTSTATSPREHVDAVRTLLRDGDVVRLCLVAFLLMGGFVACYNYLTFRLEGGPLHLSTALTSLIFLAYLAGTVSSPLAGRLSDRFGRRRLAVGSIAVSFAGLALMLPDQIVCIVAGLLVFTAGFFGAHSVASSWVSSRASGRRGQAAAMYLLAYYAGSSTFGALIGLPYEAGGWLAVSAAVAGLFLLGAIVMPGARSGRHRPGLDDHRGGTSAPRPAAD